MAEARANGEDVESQISSTLQSEKSGSKKSAMKQQPDQRSAQSPHGTSQRQDDQSKSASERPSIAKGHSAQESGSDEDGDDDLEGEDEKSDGTMGEMPSQNEMKKELIQAIEEEQRE